MKEGIFMQNHLGNKLLELRKQSKLTQEEVAEKLNVTRQTVSNWELNQTKPDIEQMKGLSKLYKISIDELIDNDIKEIINEKVSNVEKLAGLIYKILKFILIFIIGGFVLIILATILFRTIATTSIEMITTDTLNCTLNDENYIIEVKYNENNEILELGGCGKLFNILDLEKYKYSDQVIDNVIHYFEINGGSCN